MRGFHALLTIATLVPLLSLSNPALANVSCPFTISSLSIDYTGNANAAFVNNGTVYGWYICNVQGSVSVATGAGSSTFSSGACNALYSQLLTARASGQTITMSFYGSNINACNPSNLPAGNSQWVNPFPVNWSF